MKKFFCLFIFLFFILIFTACTKKQEEINSYEKIIKRGELIVGVKQDAGSFGHINNEGLNDGFDIDVAKYIAKKIIGNEEKIKFVPVTSNTRIEAITSGKVDMVIATMSVTNSRRCFVDFTIPYYFAGQTAVVKAESDIYSFADLKDKTTLVVLGSTSEQNLRRVVPTASIAGYETYEEVFSAFKSGKGDAVSTDDTILSGFISQNEGYRILNGRLSIEPYAIGIKQSDDKILKEKLDYIISEMKRNGTLKELKQKWSLI